MNSEIKSDSSHRGVLRRPWGLAILSTIVVVGGGVMADYFRGVPEDAVASYVGRQSCVECHRDETDTFQGSHHDLAMDVATPETVLGDFNNVTFENDGITSRLFRRDGKYMVETEGPSGELEEFEVKYVFGVDPLQQYMVEFDRTPDMPENEIARVQVLRISWDTARKRWFYLRPPDVKEKLEPDDPLHWTGVAQRWQTMCAECHSTNLRRNYDVKTTSYHTTFSEIDVSCEACHGPGSLHIELANQKSLFWDRHHGYGLAKLKGNDSTPQIESCAPCHSRRGVLDGTFQPGNEYCSYYQLELLTEQTYHHDGQIKDEVYVYGSFLQSKMYHQGIRCTDCHDPHSLKLKNPGNATCTSCHQHSAGKYDVPSHHHHPVGSAGAQCVNCHMPETTYMAVDPRRDHSFRVPRPDLSLTLGTPNACSQCHIDDHRETMLTDGKIEAENKDLVREGLYQDWLLAADHGDQAIADAITETNQWCEDACEKWYGEDRLTPDLYGNLLAAIRDPQTLDIQEAIEFIVRPDEASPVLVRATALDDLALRAPQQAIKAAITLLQQPPSTAKNAVGFDGRVIPDNDQPILIATAARTLGSAEPKVAQKYLMPLLEDSSRLVRSQAAQSIVRSGAYQAMHGSIRNKVDKVLGDVNREIMYASDRAGAHMAWAMLSEGRGNYFDAVKAYKDAIAVEPLMAGARTNLAALLEQLTAAASNSPDIAASLQRIAGGSDLTALQAWTKQLRDEELPLLARDASLAPDNADVQYRYGLALYLSGDLPAARKQLKLAVDLAPQIELFQTALRLLDERIEQTTGPETSSPNPPST